MLEIYNEIIKGKGTLGVLIYDAKLSKELKETMRYIKLSTKAASEMETKIEKLWPH